MIQCAGRISEKPYHIKALNMDVYSLEEINYFIYNHMNLVYRDFFCDALYNYIDNELGEKALAAQLRIMEKAESTTQEFITYILKESYYYDGNDLAKVYGFVMNIDNISENERMKVEADNLFKERKYGRARDIYMRILKDRYDEPQNKSFYADIAFSVGLCYAELFCGRSANAYFNMAYDIFPEPDYAKAAVYMSIVSNDEEELLKAIIKYKVTDEALEKIKKNVNSIVREIKNSEEFGELAMNLNEKGFAKELAEKYKDEYYRMTE